jgi:hypothetical protein
VKFNKRCELRLSKLELDRGGGPIVGGEDADVIFLLHSRAWSRRLALQFLWAQESVSRPPGLGEREEARVLRYVRMLENTALLRFVSGDLKPRHSGLCWAFTEWSGPEIRGLVKMHRWAAEHEEAADRGPLTAQFSAEEFAAVDAPGFCEKLDRLFDHRDAVWAEDERILAAIPDGHHR